MTAHEPAAHARAGGAGWAGVLAGVLGGVLSVVLVAVLAAESLAALASRPPLASHDPLPQARAGSEAGGTPKPNASATRPAQSADPRVPTSTGSASPVAAPGDDLAGRLAALVGTGSSSGRIAGLIHAIDRMSRDEIVALLVEITDRDPEEIDELPDPHDFAKSLALAVFSGWANEPPMPPGLPISFSTQNIAGLPPENGDRAIADTFESSESRIFGTFPLEPGENMTVLAKWYRVEPHEFLLLEELPVLAKGDEAFVRLDRANGWPAGSYRLEIYESGDSIEPLASGQYSTKGTDGPLRVSFHDPSLE